METSDRSSLDGPRRARSSDSSDGSDKRMIAVNLRETTNSKLVLVELSHVIENKTYDTVP